MPTEAPSLTSLVLSDGVPRTAFIVAIIVGSILNLINQGDALFGDVPFNVTKLVLTFMVPYCVSTYGSVTMKLHLHRRTIK
ncbi:MAG TPA: hypothetical protein ENI69_01925 [Rhodospirillales bacterium]|nr:hypothetical protein [Rhodospirillales bacterium]